MSRRRAPHGGVGCLAAALGIGLALPGGAALAAGAAAFEEARVRFEQNASDGDVEVVFEAKGGDEGLSRLSVVGPDGRTVVDVRAPDASTLGVREFAFESPEPRDPAALKAAYPEGVYTFSGVSVGGAELRGTSTLHHGLPATASLREPAAGARNVAPDLVIAWQPIEGLAGTIVEIEQDELGVSLVTRLAGSATHFAVPAGFLLRGTEYTLGIGTVSETGNVSYVETTFVVAE